MTGLSMTEQTLREAREFIKGVHSGKWQGGLNARNELLAKIDAALAAPAQAADLHRQIMNLPPRAFIVEGLACGLEQACYKLGHRDARHAAAELVGTNLPEAAPENAEKGTAEGQSWRSA